MTVGSEKKTLSIRPAKQCGNSMVIDQLEQKGWLGHERLVRTLLQSHVVLVVAIIRRNFVKFQDMIREILSILVSQTLWN